MDRKRAARGGPVEGAADPQTGERREGPAERPGAERFGPLEVTRLRKDDGRALLHFNFTREPSEP